jgi:hypothetical protein
LFHSEEGPPLTSILDLSIVTALLLLQNATFSTLLVLISSTAGDNTGGEQIS